MATDSYFLTKTSIDPQAMLIIGGSPAIEQYEALRGFLAAHAGREAAEVFAEPVLSRGNDVAETTVSWYVAGAGDGERLTDLAGAERESAERLLRQRLYAVSELLRDSDFGPLIGVALNIHSLDDVWVVDGHPFVTNWGILPPVAARSAEARDRHFAATLGHYLPISSAPAISREEWESRGYAAAALAGAGAGAAATLAAGEAQAGEATAGKARAASVGAESAAAAAGAPVAAATVVVSDRWRWVAPALLLALLTGALVWLLLPGTLLYPSAQRGESVIRDGAVLDAQREANRALEARVAELRQAIVGAVCTDQGELLLPDGRTPDGRIPLPPPPPPEEGQPAPEQRAEGPAQAVPDPLVPPAPQRLVVPGENNDVSSLLDLIESGSALVLAIGADGEGGHGTGFFISPDTLVTNHHVIESALAGGRVMITNKRLGQLTPAEIVAHTGPLEQTGGDYAVLRVQGVDMPSFPVWSSEQTLKLKQVVAAGFPGYVLETDANYRRMMEGQMDAIPGVVVTDGIVNAEQDFASTTRVVVHTAQISAGNSGGPLIDSCGRVVGVNTFVRNDQSSLNHLNFSLASRDLLAFLQQNGIQARQSGEPCQPSVAQTPAPSAPPAPPPAPDGSAPPAPDGSAAPAPQPQN